MLDAAWSTPEIPGANRNFLAGLIPQTGAANTKTPLLLRV